VIITRLSSDLPIVSRNQIVCDTAFVQGCLAPAVVIGARTGRGHVALPHCVLAAGNGVGRPHMRKFHRRPRELEGGSRIISLWGAGWRVIPGEATVRSNEEGRCVWYHG
jgi:hypothetical protein